ncbi:MAG: EAL domain-containing protein [Lachnospiraceae bacterium]|nr:EAL domain-containing protein [Lachnospiraceae bacterium]
MSDFKITKDMIHEEFSSQYMNVYDYRYAEGKHYYNATRRSFDDIVAPKNEAEFLGMLPDAVSCIVIIISPEKGPRLLLTHEFRYPAGRELLSVPAGLLDKSDKTSENPVIEAAKREIKEETGIDFSDEDTIEIVNPLLFSTPGMTDESNAIVMAVIHLKDTSVINNEGTEGSERIGDYILLTPEKAREYLSTGRDDHGYFYSVFTYIALGYFLNYSANMIAERKSNSPSIGKWDAETGLLTREEFAEQLSQKLVGSTRFKNPTLLLSLKITDFSRIEELYDEAEIHEIIRIAAEILIDTVRNKNLIGRISHDEFAVICEDNSAESERTKELKNGITDRFEHYNKVSGKEYTLNPSMAFIIVDPATKLEPDQILAQLTEHHRAVSESKPQSRYVPVEANEEDPQLRHIVNRILDNNELQYYFQPIICAKTGDIMGYEALMRAPHEYRITPLTLLKYATEEKRLQDVERATFNNVLKIATERKDEFKGRKIFINSIPGYYLSDEEYEKMAALYKDALSRSVVEVTEETDIEETTLNYLTKRSKDDGFQVAVDDFGTGYSNVNNLLKFLPNYVKIDRFLISEVHLDPRKQHFVNTIIQFAHDNGFQALAEGVETLEELNAVIRMGVDLIQGFYTAKPTPEILDALPPALLSEISRANLDIVSNNSRQKVYLVKDEKQLSLVDLSLQKYSILLLSGGDLTLVGNPDFLSAVSIRIKDHSSCRLTIKNVSIGDVDTTPCIDLGKESELILNIEGDNTFNGNGIRVPETTKLTLEGNGNLTITPTFTNAYGIGNDHLCAYGRIVSKMTGLLQIDISGENCVCIGGKSSVEPHAIDLRAGTFRSVCAASNCICIGSYRDKANVFISDMDIAIDVRIARGSMIGAAFGSQNIEIKNTLLKIFGSGNQVVGIGSTEKSSGRVKISEAQVNIAINGWNIAAIGTNGGGLDVELDHCKLVFYCEANIGTGIGCRDASANISLDNVGLEMNVNSANGILFGCKAEAFTDSYCYFDVKRDNIVAGRKRWFVK